MTVYRLQYGVMYRDQRQLEFELGPLTMAAYLRHEAKRSALKKADAGDEAYLELGLEQLADRIVRLGTVPRAEVTAAWLREHLNHHDYEHLMTAIAQEEAAAATFRRHGLVVAEGGAGRGDGHGVVAGGAARDASDGAARMGAVAG